MHSYLWSPSPRIGMLLPGLVVGLDKRGHCANGASHQKTASSRCHLRYSLLKYRAIPLNKLGSLKIVSNALPGLRQLDVRAVQLTDGRRSRATPACVRYPLSGSRWRARHPLVPRRPDRSRRRGRSIPPSRPCRSLSRYRRRGGCLHRRVPRPARSRLPALPAARARWEGRYRAGGRHGWKRSGR